MQIQFDHLVIFVNDLDSAVSKFKEQGLHVVYGGSHPMWGTYNALIYIGNAYIELIAVEHEHIFIQAAEQPYTLHETYEFNTRKNGYTRMAMRTTDGQMIANILKETGYDVHGPDTFSRLTRSGDTVEWKMVHPGVQDRSAIFPFIIQWNSPDDERFKALRAQHIIAPHEVGDVVISEVHVHEGDLKVIATFYEALQIPVVKREGRLIVQVGTTEINYYAEPLTNPTIVLKNSDVEKVFIFEETLYKFTK